MAENPPPGLEHDFDAIEAAVRETLRGRWFLGEFARRNRTADTGVLLEAIHRLEGAIGSAATAGPLPAKDRQAAEAARDESAADPSRLSARASELLARIAERTGTASAEIVDAAERIQEAAWKLREAGADPARCDDLDRCASDIATICGQQDITVRRMNELLGALRMLEERVATAMTGEVAGRLPPDAARETTSAASRTAGETRHPVAPDRDPRAHGTAPDPIPESLAALDALSFRERLKLFT